MKNLLAALAVVAVLVVASAAMAGISSAGTTTSKTYTIQVKDDYFDYKNSYPDGVPRKTIKRNDYVKFLWTNAEGKAGSTFNQHNVHESQDRWVSPLMTSGRYKKRFKKVGTFVVYCDKHDWMVTRIKVKE